MEHSKTGESQGESQGARFKAFQERIKARRDVRYADERAADSRAIARCLKGEREAFADLVNRYQEPALRWAFRYVRNEEDARDMVQDAFLRAYKALERFELGSSFYAWFNTILTNVCIDHLRKQKKRSSVEYDDSYVRRDVNPERSLSADMREENPTTAYELREFKSVIKDALDSLSDKHREVLLLREIEQLSYEEIAQATESHLGTVMSRLHHARKNLQEALRPYYESIGDDFHLSLIGHGVGTKRKQERPASAEPNRSDEL